MRRRTILPGVALAMLLAVGVTGCTGSSAASTGDAGVRAPAAGTGRASGGSTAAVAADRSVVVTGTLNLVAKDPLAAADRIQAIVTRAGGHLDSSEQQPGRQASADLVARIPSGVFDATLSSIRRTGTVRSQTLHATDVTTRATDYGVRIAALEASVTRLTTLLGRASDTSDLVSIESSLTTRESDLESLQAQQKALGDQVADASLTVDVVAPAAVPAPKPTNFLTGLAAGWSGLAATAAFVAVAAGTLAPWVLAAAVLAGAALLVRRVVRRRRVAETGS